MTISASDKDKWPFDPMQPGDDDPDKERNP